MGCGGACRAVPSARGPRGTLKAPAPRGAEPSSVRSLTHALDLAVPCRQLPSRCEHTRPQGALRKKKCFRDLARARDLRSARASVYPISQCCRCFFSAIPCSLATPYMVSWVRQGLGGRDGLPSSKLIMFSSWSMEPFSRPSFIIPAATTSAYNNNKSSGEMPCAGPKQGNAAPTAAKSAVRAGNAHTARPTQRRKSAFCVAEGGGGGGERGRAAVTCAASI